MIDIITLDRTYKALSKQYYRIKNQIEQVDKQIECCDRLKRFIWLNTENPFLINWTAWTLREILFFVLSNKKNFINV